MTNPHSTKHYNGSTYIFSDQHRNNQNQNKSQWTIHQDQEFFSFQLMKDENWITDDYKGWSVHRVDEKNEYLGNSSSRVKVKIAKFVDSTKNANWHGYPIDYTVSIHDKPPTKLLAKWKESEIITKKQMGKISRGKGCDI